MLHDRECLIHCFSSQSVCEIPDSVCEIRKWCFSGSKVKKVIFGANSGIRDLEGVFAGSSVEEIVFQKTRSDYVVKDGALLRLDGDDIELIFRMTRNELMEMSPYLTIVKETIFGHRDPLKIVRFDSDCRNMKIPNSAFRDLDITDVSIHGVATVPSKCFYRCRFLNNVSFPGISTVHVFARKSFSMSGLERLHVPRSVQQICSKCFCDCRSLKEITFEEGSLLESIEEKAFMNTSLTRLVVPCGVSTVTGTSFYGIPEVIFSDSGFLSMCGDSVIHNQRKCLVCFVGDASDEVVIPATIRVVGCKSFYRCGHIKRISFESHSDVELIEDDAFKHSWVDQLHIPNGLSSFGRNVLTRVGSVVVDEGNPSFDWNGDLFFTRVLSDRSMKLMNVIGSDDVIHVPDYVSSISSLSHHGQRGFVLSFSPNDLCEMRTFDAGAFRGTDVISLAVPVKTESIHANCFEKCDLLLSVSFCGCYCLKSFGDSCFLGTSISKILVPSCIEILGKSSFAKCVSLVEVEFEENSKLRVVADECFRDCVSLRAVVLPNSVEVIDVWAFQGSLISEFRFPSSLTELGRHCFSRNLAKISSLCGLNIRSIPYECFQSCQLKSVEIPAFVLKIEESAFEDCPYLDTVTFESGSRLQNIEGSAFRGTCISEIYLPGTLQSIGARAFQATKLVEICLPKALQELDDLVFADCSLLRCVNFEEDSSITNIKGQNVFKGTAECQITIPESVVKFKGNFLPVGCYVSISSENSSYVCDDQFVYNTDRTKLVRCFKPESSVFIPKSVQCIESGCFEDCQCIREVFFEEGSDLREIKSEVFKRLELTRLLLPKSLKNIGKRSFFKCKLGTLEFEDESQLNEIDSALGRVDLLLLPKLVEHVRPSALIDVRRVDVRSEYFHSEWPFLLSKDHQILVFMFDMDVVDVVVPNSVRVLRKKCFCGRRQVSSICFESDSDLRVIECRALQDTSIESFCVPRLVERIEDKAFSGCPFLNDLTFDDDCVLTSLNRGIFEETHLRSLYIPSRVESIEPRSLCGIQHISISPKNVHLSPESDEFKCGCGLSTLGSFDDRHVFIFDSNVESIPFHEFSGNEDIQEVSFSECHSLLSIGDGAFEDSSLCSISLPSSIESLGNNCFSGCTKLASTEFSSDCALSVPPACLFSRAAVESIIVPCNVQEIGSRCFADSPLSSLDFSEGTCLRVIGKEAFRHTSLENVTLPKTVLEIGDMCFSDTSSLSSFVFCEGSELQRIGIKCFKGTSIKKIEIPPFVHEIGFGSLSDVKKVVIHEGNDHFVSDDSLLLSKDGYSVHGCLRSTRHLELPSKAVRVMKGSFIENAHFMFVVIPRNVEYLGNECFSGCKVLEEVNFLPQSKLGFVGNGCFSECRRLTSVSFDGLVRLKIFSEEMFHHTGIRSIKVPKFVRVIQSRCFYRCSALSSVEFYSDCCLKRICEEAFSSCGLVNVHFPRSLIALGDGAFSGCSRLKSVSFAADSSLQFIGSNCFQCKCSFELPETIYMIKGDSFGPNCEVHMASNNETIIEAFEEWKNDRDHCFVNPTMEANDFIKGVFNLCDCGFVGSGGQGVVKVKRSMISGDIFAVKVIDYGGFRGQDKTGLMWEDFKSRTSDMQQLHHPCLVKIKGCCFDDDRWRITVFMDYIKGPPLHDESCCSSGSVNLKTVLEKRPSWWTKSVLSIVILGITRGIDYVHNSGLVHRDLKPSNVLIDEQFHCKICDFDVGRRLDFEESGMTVNVGTLKYMAPECASGKYSVKSDYYSFGVLLYEVFEGTESTCRSCVDSSRVCFSEATPVGIQEFIRDCLVPDPDERACNLDDDTNPLFSSLYGLLCAHMNFDEEEMISVQEFVANVEMEEDEIFANES